MITLLHGDNVVSSRKALETLKSKNQEKEIVSLNGAKTTFADLKQALESSSLFSSARLVILENFFSSRPDKKKLAYLTSGDFNSDLILWEKKKVSPGKIKKLGSGTKTKLFKTPTLLFKFLDSFGSSNQKGSLLLLKKVLGSSPASLVFYLLVKRVRNLILVKSKKKPPRLRGWQIKRLKGQSRFFDLNSLKKIYRRLLEIDENQKTGKNNFDLQGEIELLVLEIDRN